MDLQRRAAQRNTAPDFAPAAFQPTGPGENRVHEGEGLISNEPLVNEESK